MKDFARSLVVVAVTACFASAAFAADLTGAAAGDARTKVVTAVALANIATASNDGEALLVATRLLADSGAVAKPGEALKDGKPVLFDIAAMAASAKAMGADAAKADALATQPMAARSDGYWYYSCDSYNNCQWIYAGW